VVNTKKTLLLTIDPRCTRAILRGEKTWEFRKVIWRDPIDRDRVYLYASVPVKRVVGTCRVASILEDRPERLWEKCRHEAGISEEEFFAYFRGKGKGYAIQIKAVEPLPTPVPLRPGANPLSWCYFVPDPALLQGRGNAPHSRDENRDRKKTPV